MVKIHSLFLNSICQWGGKNKKAMGSREAAHGPYFQFT